VDLLRNIFQEFTTPSDQAHFGALLSQR